MYFFVVQRVEGFTYTTRSEGTSVDRQGGIGANRGELFRNIQGNRLVARGGARGGILVLGDSCNLGVGRGLVAEHRCLADGGSVPLQSAEHDGVGHPVDIIRGLGVGERLIGDNLLEAVEVLHVRGSVGGSSIAKKSEDGVRDALRVVELQVLLGRGDDGLVRVLLGNLPLHDTGVKGDLTGSSQPGEGEKRDLILHL